MILYEVETHWRANKRLLIVQLSCKLCVLHYGLICPLRGYIRKSVNIMLGRSHFYASSVRAWHNFLCTFPRSGWCCLQLVLLRCVLYLLITELPGTGRYLLVSAWQKALWQEEVCKQMRHSWVLGVRRSLLAEQLQMEGKCFGLCSAQVRTVGSWQQFFLPFTLTLSSALSKCCLKTRWKMVICRKRTWEENMKCPKTPAITICTVQWSLYVPHSGHYTYHTVVTICTAQWSLYVPHSGHYMYRTAVTICTA